MASILTCCHVFPPKRNEGKDDIWMAPNWDTADGPGFLTVSLVASPWAPILHPQGFQTSTKLIRLCQNPTKKWINQKTFQPKEIQGIFTLKKVSLIMYSREPKLHQFPDSSVRQGNGPMRPGHSRVTSKSQLQCVLQIMK